MSTTTATLVRFNQKYIVLQPDEDVTREIQQRQVEKVEIRLNDGRCISNEQRKKIFALIRDIADWNGDTPEDIRAFLTWDFCSVRDIELFSLSDVDMTTAKEFINYLIDFCFEWNIPTKDTMLNRTDDIGHYLYLCLEHRKCAICNKPAEVHHVDRIGMGRDRERIVHIGLKAIALCPEHHMEAHQREKELFKENFVYGIKLDKYLCDKLRLNINPRK